MPSRNVLKIDVQDSYYHIYARGASRHEIFLPFSRNEPRNVRAVKVVVRCISD